MSNVFTELFGFGKKALREDLAAAKHDLKALEVDAGVRFTHVRTEVAKAVDTARKNLATAVAAAEPTVKAAVDSELAALAAKIFSVLA